MVQSLTGERRSPGAALKVLEERYRPHGPPNKGSERMAVVLVDEVDLLVTKNQSVRALPDLGGPRVALWLSMGMCWILCL